MHKYLPVIVGTAQVIQQGVSLEKSLNPLELMCQAVKEALVDSGCTEIVSQIDGILVTQGLWGYGNPGAEIARQLGIEKAETVIGVISGSMSQALFADAANAIASGEKRAAVIVGGEAGYFHRHADKSGIELDWVNPDGEEPDRRKGANDIMQDDERAIGINAAVQIFSMFENARRHQKGLSRDENNKEIAELWANFAAVAKDNPYAWIRDGKSAEEIGRVTMDNRMIGYPYSKNMIANMFVDQSAAVILCSAELAIEMGVPEEKLVYVHGLVDMEVDIPMRNRDSFHSLPSLGIAGKALSELVGMALADAEHIDIYSCFPSAVQISAEEFDIDIERQLTVTGGLAYSGGPMNNYVLQSLAAMTKILRNNPGDHGLVSGIGGWMGKHALGLYSTDKPVNGYCYKNCKDLVADQPQREYIDDYQGDAMIETYALDFTRQGNPKSAILACLTDDGRRAWARIDNIIDLQTMVDKEVCGMRVQIASQKKARLA
tara:strand:- start:390 stop:1859 length:1470 start_codon:yes stop_codon:yes gene_type:complete